MKTKQIIALCCLSIWCVALSGCLVIGGKTHVCASSKESDERVAQLESRIKTLEQYAGISPPQVTVASATVHAQ